MVFQDNTQFDITDIPVLRGYQVDAKDLIRNNWKNGHNKQILLLPTGGGKTVVFCDMVYNTLKSNPGRKCLILTHRKELFRQASKKLKAYGVEASNLNDKVPSNKINFASRCLVAMCDTYEKRLKKFPVLGEYDLIVIDECHIGNFKKIFHLWNEQGRPNQRVIGCTATPIATAKKDPLKNYYTEIVSPVTIKELIQLGSLVPARTYSADIINRGSIVTDSKNDDGYYAKSQMLQFDKREVYEGLIDKFKAHCLNEDGSPRRTICFNINKEHSKKVCQAFIDAGYSAVHVDSDDEDEVRDKKFEDFEAGVYDILCNVNIATAGYDFPPISCVIINRATKSISFWLQACGRGSRPAPGKDRFIILDMASNWTELLPWQTTRDWRALFFEDISDSPSSGPPAKLCKACKCLNAISARVCVDCGAAFPAPMKEPPQNPDFVEIPDESPDDMTTERRSEIDSIIANRSNVPYNTFEVPELLDVAKVLGYKKQTAWVMHRLAERCSTLDEFKKELQYLADCKGYHPGWIRFAIEPFVSRYDKVESPV